MKLTSTPPIHRQLRDQLYQKYDQLISQGTYLPLTSSSFAWGLLLLFCFFLVPPTSRFHNRFTRYIVFAAVLSWHTYLVTCFQAKSVAVVYGAGISSAWGTLWAATLLVFRDAKTEFKRLEQREIAGDGGNSDVNATTTQHSLRHKADESDLRKRAQVSEHKSEANVPIPQPEHRDNFEYIWQSYPTQPTFWHRFCWNLDLLTNFRGLGWSWRISGLPSLPLHVQESLSQTSPSSSSDQNTLKDTPISHIGIRRYDTTPSLLKHNIYLLLRHYLTIDLLLTLMHHDAYFYTGLQSSPPPAYFASTILAHSPLPDVLNPIILKIYRLLLSMLMVSTCLKFACALGPPTFAYLLSATTSPFRHAPFPLNQLAFCTVTSQPWLYPDAFGPYTNVFSRGLAGWWGAWWHQLFRFAFQSAGEFAVDKLGVSRKSVAGKVVQAVVVFFVSGCVHASGSLMLSARREEARPVSGAMAFFVVQCVGVCVEMGGRMLWKRVMNDGGSGASDKNRGHAMEKKKEREVRPTWLMGVLRFTWVHVWFYFTAGLLVDDFARSGVWTFEPIGVSVLRGLGMGVQGDGWWCWGGGPMAWWYDGGFRRPWLTGVAF